VVEGFRDLNFYRQLERETSDHEADDKVHPPINSSSRSFFINNQHGPLAQESRRLVDDILAHPNS
jgi:hypothetical protein